MAFPPAPDPAVLRPRKLWFWVGGLIIALGLVGGVTGFAVGISGVVNSTSTVAEFGTDEPTTFEADEANTDSDTWKLYSNQDVPFSDAEEYCEVTGSDGEVSLSNPGYDSESTVNGERSVLIAQLDITEPGEYTVECDANANTVLSVGYGPGIGENAMGIVGSIATLILAPLLGIIAGLTMIVVTAVRRSRHRTRLQAASGYGPGQYGPPGGSYGAPPGKIQ